MEAGKAVSSNRLRNNNPIDLYVKTDCLKGTDINQGGIVSLEPLCGWP